MPQDEELIEVFEAAFPAGDGHVRGYLLLVRRLYGLGIPRRGVHLEHGVRQKSPAHLPIPLEPVDSRDAGRSYEDREQGQRGGNGQRQHQAKGRQSVGQPQQQGYPQPLKFIKPAFIIYIPSELIVPQHIRHIGQLAARDGERQQRTEPRRDAAQEPEQQGERQKAYDCL